MKTKFTREQAKELGEMFGVITVGLGFMLLWMPFLHMIVWIHELIQ